MGKSKRPDRWYAVYEANHDAVLVFKKYRHLTEYVAEELDVPIEYLLDITLSELKDKLDSKGKMLERIKVSLNRKGELMSVLGDTHLAYLVADFEYQD